MTLYVPGSKKPYIGDGHPTFNDGNPYNGKINPYYWVDDHPLNKSQHNIEPSPAHQTPEPGWALAFGPDHQSGTFTFLRFLKNVEPAWLAMKARLGRKIRGYTTED